MKRIYQCPATHAVALHPEYSLLLTLSGTGNDSNHPDEGPDLGYGGAASDFTDSSFEAE